MFDQGIAEHDLRKFDGKVIFVRRPVLGYRRPNSDGRDRNILPDELLRSSEIRSQAKELTVLVLG